MNALETLTDLAGRPLAELDLFWEDVPTDRLNDHPGGHPNSIAWLVWHSGREIDAQVAGLGGRQEVWSAQGWGRRLGPDVPSGDHGFGHSAAEARSVVVRDKDLLRGYLAAVTQASRDYLATLEEADLDEVVDTHWDPPVTRGVRLVSVYADALQHVGQAAYVAGMPDPS